MKQSVKESCFICFGSATREEANKRVKTSLKEEDMFERSRKEMRLKEIGLIYIVGKITKSYGHIKRPILIYFSFKGTQRFFILVFNSSFGFIC